ncbi:MAG: hypothetical protein ACJAUV_000586 [Flavobacteriales bacterium]|jgi:hypothetical protein
MDFRKANLVFGWLTFLVASVVYLLTIEPTASFWDAGEFIATAVKLQVGHPPGAPFFMLVGRLFSLFGPISAAAVAINVLSAMSSSFTILFLFWTITAFAKKLALRSGEMNSNKLIAIIGSGVVGGLAYTFSDSFWFSAVEGEVYALSSLFTAVVFWAIIKWEGVADQPHSTKWLVLIAYLMGLSIGVHLLNLLTIPAMAFVYYFKRYEVSTKGIIYTFIISTGILGVIQAIIIPGTVKLAGTFEKMFVNGMGMPFNSGVIVYFILITAVISFGLYWTQKNDHPMYNTAIMSVLVILIGYSTFATIVIRSSANTPMDENNPENVFSLVSYLNREQYGDRPLMHGQFWNAPLDRKKDRADGDPVYTKAYVVKNGVRVERTFINVFEAEKYVSENKNKSLEISHEYIISDPKKGTEYNYDKEYTTIFPRMYSSQAHHVKEYKKWSNFKGKPARVPDSNGKRLKPTFGENLTFFFSYQINWMYWRYFMWNFSGRQNDVQGHGNILDGNWKTGLNFIDAERLGNQDELADSLANNKANNHFYLLPFLLGLIGLIYLLVRTPKEAVVTILLFLLTGMAIVIYLNQYPMQPRERDYAFVGSFYAFAIWIGLGVYALFDMASQFVVKDLKKVAMYVLGAGALMYVVELGNGDHAVSYSIFYMALLGLGAAALMMTIGKKIGSKGTAIMSFGLCLFIPLVMAADGWDDHSRAKRTTAVDFAKNYLDSCAPNAILFTNGDNDTFPLWYVQEVEGYRTDVRVVNLSLLNTDWYINQMKRKAYDSDPVPFGMIEEKYRQGTRDVVILDKSKNPRGVYVDIDQAIAFVERDDAKTTGYQQSMHYMPTNKFSLAVDKEFVVANGTVDIKDTARIVDQVEWTINKTYILKNNLMVLDLLARNDWKRPIYFAVTTGPDSYIGLKDYFQLEGLAYRLVPIKAASSQNPNVLGEIKTDLMYDNLMNKFTWGGMDTEDIYMDENNLRMTTNLRLQFANLAEQLISEGDKDKAKAILDKAFEVMPEKNVPFTRVVLPLVESYFQIGDVEKAEQLSLRLFEIFEDDFDFYNSLEPAFAKSLQQDMQMSIMVNGRINQLVNQLMPGSELSKDLQERYKILESNYYAKMNAIEGRRKQPGKF